MNNYQYAHQPYGKLVEDDVAQGQPMEHQIQMTNMVNTQQPLHATQQIPPQHFQQQQVYNYPPLPNQSQMNAPNMYATGVPQNNNFVGYSQPYNHPQMGIPPNQQNFATMPVNRYPNSRYPQQLYCENCKQCNQTKVAFKNGSGAYIAGGIIAACGFWLGCCLIPCMVDDCKDAEHFCSRCGLKVGSKRFLFD